MDAYGELGMIRNLIFAITVCVIFVTAVQAETVYDLFQLAEEDWEVSDLASFGRVSSATRHRSGRL